MKTQDKSVSFCFVSLCVNVTNGLFVGSLAINYGFDFFENKEPQKCKCMHLWHLLFKSFHSSQQYPVNQNQVNQAHLLCC